MTTECAVQTIDSPLGPLVAAASADGVCLVEFSDPTRVAAQMAALQHRLPSTIVEKTNPHLEHLRRELDEYFAGRLTRFTVPIVVTGTPFQERVWSELQRIPYGSTRSYAEVARTLGAPGASRAVGHANGLNRIAIVVPCHRVINTSGSLGGYGGLVWRKEALLRLEGVALPPHSKLFV